MDKSLHDKRRLSMDNQPVPVSSPICAKESISSGQLQSSSAGLQSEAPLTSAISISTSCAGGGNDIMEATSTSAPTAIPSPTPRTTGAAGTASSSLRRPRPESLNLTSTNSSQANLVSSNASQVALDSASLRTNNSSDCIVTYDSDCYWPLSNDSSGSKINTIQGSATRLDKQANETDLVNDGDFVVRHGIHQQRQSVVDLNNVATTATAAAKALAMFTNENHCLGQQQQQSMNNELVQEEEQEDEEEQHNFTIGPIAGNGCEENNMAIYLASNQLHHHHHNELYGREHCRDGSNDIDDDVDDLNEVDGDRTYAPHKQVIVGICAMEKKAQSKPMKEILRRLEDYFEFIKTLVFEESVILYKPIEEWPLCDCLISFHSKGFPLSKAIEYARLRRPFLVNDLDIQYDIQDRRKVYKILEEADIELPRYAVLDRDSANPEDRELIESDDHIEVANFVFNKPFVEKPISAEDHNICIYYPAHAGGGSQRLFRKIGCRSSVYSNESHVRKTGSYIYEEFMPTDGTDVKVYTAGPDYAHAEARKSPALDGKVERDMDGKEIRYPVILTNREKLIARKVCLAFKQTVCGFDLLRANGRSYVCDVNGFSFVKSSMKYYEDCSKILGNMMLRALAPQLHIPWSIPFQLDDPPIVPTTFGRMMELRCVIAVIRHGDRTPKQKMKLEVKHPKFFELYQKYGNTKNGQAKLKKPKQLQEVLDIARYLLGELPDQPLTGEVVEPRVKLKQLKSVLEMYGHFSGINRKVQLKYQPNGRPRRSSSEDEVAREPSLVLILKWGGELTPAGRVQAEDLGRCFRRLYPASGDYSGPQGLGLLRLHSTFRHDLKIYASDEGRVQMTAGAFAKGFLALEGELTPILFQMVKSANTNGLLDNDCESSKCQKLVKERLHNIMQKNFDLNDEDMEILNPTNAPSIEAACKFIGNPYQACEKVYKLIKELNTLIKSKRQDNSYTQEYHLYHGETWDLLQRRWAKLEKDFKFKRSKKFDISKIPDIYDCIKYDLQHNQHTLQFQFAHELHTYAKALADIVIPQEYGITAQEKLMISLGTCSPLLRKIQADLLRNADSSNEDETESVNRLDPKYSHGVSSPDRHVRTRLYFTSESHIHSLCTALQFGGLLDVKRDEQWQRSMEFLSAISELNYLSQIVIMLYEDPTKEPSSDDRFHVEIHFSSGVINRISQQNMPTEPQGPGFRPHLHNKSYSNASSTGSGNAGGQKDNGDLVAGSDSPGAKMRTRMTSGNKDNSMIKEEPTDDERSPTETLDQGSKAVGGQKGSSVCQTSTPIPTVAASSGLPITPVLPVKNNWKTYEQYLASELTTTPHLFRQHRRRAYHNQQLITLPPTYHTIHHLNFSPSTLSSVAQTSASMSTSPQQTGLQQRYLAHDAQQQQQHQGPIIRQFFTLSASMPIQYKSNQNPRACSVADVSQYCGGPSSLISTAVISGSSPELVAVCPYSPNIRPLETLHNELSLKMFNDFVTRLTRNHRSSNNQLDHNNHHHRHHHHSNLDLSAEGARSPNSGASSTGNNDAARPATGSNSNLNNNSSKSSNKSSSGQQHEAGGRQGQSGSGAGGSIGIGVGSIRNYSQSGGGGGGSASAGIGCLGSATAANSGREQQSNRALGLSPGNSLSNSLIWSGPPSSFASTPGPSSPTSAIELWSKLELEDSITTNTDNEVGYAPGGNNLVGSATATGTTTTSSTATIGMPTSANQ